MTAEETHQQQATDDGMPEPPAGRAYKKGTRVRSVKFAAIKGEIVGYDDDILLPLIRWDGDPPGAHPEACEAHEFEMLTSGDDSMLLDAARGAKEVAILATLLLIKTQGDASAALALLDTDPPFCPPFKVWGMDATRIAQQAIREALKLRGEI